MIFNLEATTEGSAIITTFLPLPDNENDHFGSYHFLVGSRDGMLRLFEVFLFEFGHFHTTIHFSMSM